MVFRDEVFWLHPGFPGSVRVIQFFTETRRDEKRRAEDGIDFSQSSIRSRPRCRRSRRPHQIQESGCSSFCLFLSPSTIAWAILGGADVLAWKCLCDDVLLNSLQRASRPHARTGSIHKVIVWWVALELHSLIAWCLVLERLPEPPQREVASGRLHEGVRRKMCPQVVKH